MVHNFDNHIVDPNVNDLHALQYDLIRNSCLAKQATPRCKILINSTTVDYRDCSRVRLAVLFLSSCS
jgi:hypothetical protein